MIIILKKNLKKASDNVASALLKCFAKPFNKGLFLFFPFTVFKLFLELKDERDNERDFRHDSRRRSP